MVRERVSVAMGAASVSDSATRPNVSFVTLGCAKNEVDTRQMKRRLRSAGFAVEAEPDECDCIVINTCSFIQAATEESIEAVLEAAELPGVAEGRVPLIVAGCMPARYGEQLACAIGEASAFVPCSREDDIVEVVREAIGEAPFRCSALPQDSDSVTCETFAYVKIADGCDRFCSFCTIPYIRGRYRSFSYDDIRDEVEACARDGAREVVLIAQDTGRYGFDLPEPASLPWLLGRLAQEFPDLWFRVMYLEPEGVSDELLSTIAAHDNICSYLDIPFQHVDPQVLTAMNRQGSAGEFLALLERASERVEGIALRTTLIAGFPGETDEQFDALCDFVEQAPLDYVGVFAYSREEGTRAASLPDQVDEDEKRARAQRLRDLADAVCASRIAQRVGERLNVLVEGREEDGQLFGRAQCQAPEVDGVTYLDDGEVGRFVSASITDTLLYEMEGEVHGESRC